MKLWILTKESDVYEWQGELFVSAWLVKPSYRQLQLVLPELPGRKLVHIEKGGGKHRDETWWYNLHEVEEGCGIEAKMFPPPVEVDKFDEFMGGLPTDSYGDFLSEFDIDTIDEDRKW